MMRTIRHEGFHQYMDVFLPSAPLWLNEGLAEYFEQSRTARGKPVAGMIQEGHIRQLALLRPTRRPSLAKILSMESREFYAMPQVSYPTSWAFVHFLRHTTRQNRKAFDRLIENLRTGVSIEVAHGELMGTARPSKLETEFWQYVAKLRTTRR